MYDAIATMELIPEKHKQHFNSAWQSVSRANSKPVEQKEKKVWFDLSTQVCLPAGSSLKRRYSMERVVTRGF